MKVKIVKAAALILAMLCILCFPIPASAVSQGTDGTELQVMKPQNFQIHLGEEWAGIGFELTTDAGKYPGVIPVGEDGVLRLEIGGSENYILFCLNSSSNIPSTGDELQLEEGSEAPTEAEDGMSGYLLCNDLAADDIPVSLRGRNHQPVHQRYLRRCQW